MKFKLLFVILTILNLALNVFAIDTFMFNIRESLGLSEEQSITVVMTFLTKTLPFLALITVMTSIAYYYFSRKLNRLVLLKQHMIHYTQGNIESGLLLSFNSRSSVGSACRRVSCTSMSCMYSFYLLEFCTFSTVFN